MLIDIIGFTYLEIEYFFPDVNRLVAQYNDLARAALKHVRHGQTTEPTRPYCFKAQRIQYKICDVTNENQVRDVVEEAAEFGNGLDGVVANAGGGGGMAPYHLQDLDEFTRVLHLNVLGTMLCVKHSVPFLKESDKGSFVGMSSIASHLTHLWFGAYPAAKAGIEAIMRNAADEFGPANIRFNAIRPGFIATEIMEAIPKNSEVYESYITNTPLGDVGEPKDVAALARFLISSESRWITGQCINVDGGHSLRRGPQFTQFLANFSHDQLYGELPTDD